MRRALPAIITVVLLAGVLYLAWRRGRQTPKPDDPVWALTDATREADVQDYLDCFTGDLRERLEQTVREQGEAAFADYLQRTNQDITGTAVHDQKVLSPDQARLKVVFIYRDGEQTQWMTVRRQGRRWRIAEVTGERRKESLIPYGTPVGPLDVDVGKPDEEREETGVAP